MPFDFFASVDFWAIASGVIALITLLFYLLDRIERKRLHSFFLKGKRFPARKIKYSFEFFSGARVDKLSFKASNYKSRSIENQILNCIKEGRSIVLLGSPLRGKTRVMVESVKKLKRTDCIIALPSKFEGEIQFPRKKWFSKKHLLILDDLQDFFKAPNNAIRLIDVAFQNKITIVANCRTSGEWQTVCNAYDTISKRLDIIEIPAPSAEEIAGVLEANGLKSVPSFFDGKNIGTLLIDLDTMRERYGAVKTRAEGKILLCIKELSRLGITNEHGEVENQKIKMIAEKAHNLIVSYNQLNRLIQWVVDNDFVVQKNRGLYPEAVYFDKIVEPDYSITEIIDSGLRTFSQQEIRFAGLIYSASGLPDAKLIMDFLSSRNIRLSTEEYNEFIAKQVSYEDAYKVYKDIIADGVAPDERTYFTLISFYVKSIRYSKDYATDSEVITVLNRAVESFDKVSKGNVDLDVYLASGTALSVLSRTDPHPESLLHQACEKYKKFTDSGGSYFQAYYNWGNALSRLFEITGNDSFLIEACEKFRSAAKINPGEFRIFYNWGNALLEYSKLTNDINNYKDAIEKFRSAAKLNPNDSDVYYNWGNTLTRASTVSEKDTDFLIEACEKYEKATRIRPDFVDAFYNWVVALSLLAKKSPDKISLWKAACEKFERIEQITDQDCTLFHDWGKTLGVIALQTNNDLRLLHEACQKLQQAAELCSANDKILLDWWNMINFLISIDDGQRRSNLESQLLTCHQLRPDLVDEDGSWIEQ